LKGVEMVIQKLVVTFKGAVPVDLGNLEDVLGKEFPEHTVSVSRVDELVVGPDGGGAPLPNTSADDTARACNWDKVGSPEFDGCNGCPNWRPCSPGPLADLDKPGGSQPAPEWRSWRRSDKFEPTFIEIFILILTLILVFLPHKLANCNLLLPECISSSWDICFPLNHWICSINNLMTLYPIIGLMICSAIIFSMAALLARQWWLFHSNRQSSAGVSVSGLSVNKTDGACPWCGDPLNTAGGCSNIHCSYPFVSRPIP
jgi:hypothetical protein